MIAGYGFIAFLGWLLFLRIPGQHKSDQHDMNPITSDISKNVFTGSSLTTTTVEPETSNSELHESQPTTEGATDKNLLGDTQQILSSGLPSQEKTSFAQFETEQRDCNVVTAAMDALTSYQAKPGVELARVGWLDLLGSVWSCVVVGPGWVELCTIRARSDTTSEIQTIRMEIDRLKQAYAH